MIRKLEILNKAEGMDLVLIGFYKSEIDTEILVEIAELGLRVTLFEFNKQGIGILELSTAVQIYETDFN